MGHVLHDPVGRHQRLLCPHRAARKQPRSARPSRRRRPDGRSAIKGMEDGWTTHDAKPRHPPPRATGTSSIIRVAIIRWK